MANRSRLRRATDLFAEGAECYLGQDEDGPIVVWVNKLNAFETDEARKDGLAKRGAYIAELTKSDNDEHKGQVAEMSDWTDEELIANLVDFEDGTRYIAAVDDLEADEEWRDVIDRNRRLPELLDDEGAADDDPRRQEIADSFMAYQNELRKRQEDSRETAIEALANVARAELEKRFLKSWRDRKAVTVFIEEERVSQTYFAARDCAAKVTELVDGGREYDHSPCNHRVMFFGQRSEVRQQPDELIGKIVRTLEQETMGQRAAGNSVAPVSSSASSERSEPAEAPSAASSQQETLPEPVATSS